MCGLVSGRCGVPVLELGAVDLGGLLLTDVWWPCRSVTRFDPRLTGARTMTLMLGVDVPAEQSVRPPSRWTGDRCGGAASSSLARATWISCGLIWTWPIRAAGHQEAELAKQKSLVLNYDVPPATCGMRTSSPSGRASSRPSPRGCGRCPRASSTSGRGEQAIPARSPQRAITETGHCCPRCA